MGLFDWLFKSERGDAGGHGTAWGVSENGNATLVLGAIRFTVFRQDHGWKYCIADVQDQNEPYFSEAYDSEEAAREEALANLEGKPSRHESLSAARRRERKQRWEEIIIERDRTIDGLRANLASDPNPSLTALRKPEAKIASHLKQLDWQLSEYRGAGVSEETIARAERQKLALEKLSGEVAERIAAKTALRKPRSAPASASKLSAELAAKVDAVTWELAETRVMPTEEQAWLTRAFAVADGQISGAPEFLNQDEASFHAFMKTADQDLAWQCETVAASFHRYKVSGEVPAPHYPMRIAVLLRKAKDFDRERLFLAAWCKHFPKGNGTTYAAIADRAKKVGAFKKAQ